MAILVPSRVNKYFFMVISSKKTLLICELPICERKPVSRETCSILPWTGTPSPCNPKGKIQKHGTPPFRKLFVLEGAKSRVGFGHCRWHRKVCTWWSAKTCSNRSLRPLCHFQTTQRTQRSMAIWPRWMELSLMATSSLASWHFLQAAWKKVGRCFPLLWFGFLGFKFLVVFDLFILDLSYWIPIRFVWKQVLLGAPQY